MSIIVTNSYAMGLSWGHSLAVVVIVVVVLSS